MIDMVYKIIEFDKKDGYEKQGLGGSLIEPAEPWSGTVDLYGNASGTFSMVFDIRHSDPNNTPKVDKYKRGEILYIYKAKVVELKDFTILYEKLKKLQLIAVGEDRDEVESCMLILTALRAISSDEKIPIGEKVATKLNKIYMKYNKEQV